ncbi:unnamed protein product, partial [Meganyctiphanes norvegica]
MSQCHSCIWLLKLALLQLTAYSANELQFPSSSGPPQLNRNETYIVSENDNVTLECRGKKNVTWSHHLTPYDGQEYFSEDWLCSRDGEWEYCSTLKITQALASETGLYRCQYQDNKDLYDSTMLYVQDNNRSVVYHDRNVLTVVGAELYLRCLPTSPNISLRLVKDGTDVIDNFTWKSTIGFVKDYAVVSDSGVYGCKTTDSNYDQDQDHISVEVIAPTPLYPAIEDHCDADHYVAGIDFELTCYVYSGEQDFIFNWSLPNNNTMYEVKKKYSNAAGTRYESMIFIQHPTVEDSGTYTCNVDGNLVTNGMSGNKTIKIIDSCNATEYVELENNIDSATLKEGEDFKWRVEIKSFPPKPLLIYQCNNNVIHNDTKIDCKKDEPFIIKNVTHDHFGNYSLEVQTRQGNQSYCRGRRAFRMVSKQAFFFLEIESKPVIKSLLAPPAVVADGESVMVVATCTVIAFPEPTINWYFEHDGYVSIILGDNKTDEAPGNIWTATFESQTNVSGNLRCESSNHFGNISKSVLLNITEEEAVKFVDANFGWEPVVEVKWNDDFQINCSVTGHPTPNIFWFKDDVLINTNDSNDERRTWLPNAENPQQVKLENVDEIDEGTYKCVANNTKNEIHRSVKLNIEDKSDEVVVWTPGRRASLGIIFVLIVILILIIIRLFKKVKREKKFKESIRRNHAFLFQQGNPDAINNEFTADEQAHLLPYDLSWEISRENIKQGKILGSGAFGQVMKAEVKGLEEDGSSKIVALKMVKSQEDASQVRALALELKIMIHLGKHLNIVNLVGAHTADIEKGELWILVEYCKFGNLLVYMHKHKSKFINQIEPDTGNINPHITGSDCNGSPSVTDNRLGTSPGSMSPGSCIENPGYGIIVTDPDIGIGSADTINRRKISPDSQRGGLHPTLHSQSQRVYSDMSPISDTVTSPMSDIGVDSVGNPMFQDYGGIIPGKNGPFTTTDLVCWAWQITQGMDYLAQRK